MDLGAVAQVEQHLGLAQRDLLALPAGDVGKKAVGKFRILATGIVHQSLGETAEESGVLANALKLGPGGHVARSAP